MLNFWDRLWIVSMNMVKDYYKERDKQRLRWKKFCNKCISEIMEEDTKIVKVIEDAVSKQRSNYFHDDIYKGIIQLPLYGFLLVLRNQGAPTDDQIRLLDAYFSNLKIDFSRTDFLKATTTQNNAYQSLQRLCFISDKSAGDFWIQFFKLLYRTESDTSYIEKVINSFCNMTMRFAAMNKKMDDYYLLKSLESFINSVHKQSVLCRDIPEDIVDFFGDVSFIEHYNRFKKEMVVVLDYTIEEQTEDLNTQSVITTFSFGVIYQIISRCHGSIQDKIKMADDILSQIDIGSDIDGNYMFKYMEIADLNETSLLAAMAHYYTDIENNNPIGWIMVYRMSGSYNYKTQIPVTSMQEATNFVIGMDNYLSKKYPMRGFGKIGEEYCKEVGKYVMKDMEENVTFE